MCIHYINLIKVDFYFQCIPRKDNFTLATYIDKLVKLYLEFLNNFKQAIQFLEHVN